MSLDPQAGCFSRRPRADGPGVDEPRRERKGCHANGRQAHNRNLQPDGWTKALRGAHLNVEPGPYVVFAVTDTGTGMTSEVQSHLFEPFYTTKEPGKRFTGLGLSTVYGIVVNQSGGSIWVSANLGAEPHFEYSFLGVALKPPGSTGRHRTSISRARNHSAGGGRARSAEIHAGDPGTIRLHRSGSTQRRGGPGCMARKHTGAHSMLMTDIIMPLMGGMELNEKFSAEFPGVPVLFMSGYTDQIMLHWTTLGAYIQKPFTVIRSPDTGARTAGSERPDSRWRREDPRRLTNPPRQQAAVDSQQLGRIQSGNNRRPPKRPALEAAPGWRL